MVVVMANRAQRDFDDLGMTTKRRVLAALVRLENWPDVSGIKRLSADWKGFMRMRVGDWRVVFHLRGDRIEVVRIAHRREVYE